MIFTFLSWSGMLAFFVRRHLWRAEARGWGVNLLRQGDLVLEYLLAGWWSIVEGLHRR